MCVVSGDLASVVVRMADHMKSSCVSQKFQNAALFSFGDRFTTSPQFMKLFREGMDLVEETAEYLDGAGRAESKHLTPPSSLAYTSESIRLTTRLTQLASWLLVRRAIASGEITAAQAHTHRHRVTLSPQTANLSEGFDALPETFKRLIAESYRLHDRITRLERILGHGTPANKHASPIDGQIERIRIEFPAA
jgi:regulator of CtrA degradation